MDMDNNEQDTEDKLPGKSFDINFVSIFIALVGGLFIAAIFVLIKKRKSRRKDFIIVGLCESGKTALYLQLAHTIFRPTFTSIVPNTTEYDCDNKLIKIVDIPGHDRVRDKFLDQYKYKAKGIIFVIDSVSVQKEICEVADCLYGMLADRALSSCSVVIACNKQDEPMSKSSQVVRTLLEKELNLIRRTRATQLQSVDENNKNKSCFLGKEGKDFNFSHITQNVEFLECSAKENQLSDVVNWIKSTL